MFPELYYAGEPLKLRSILDILNSINSVFNKVFPSNKMFSWSTDQTWYTSKKFQPASKAKPIGREQINNVNQTLLSINTPASIRKAVYVGTTFNSAGRSGETAYTCLDDGAFWDYDEEKFSVQ